MIAQWVCMRFETARLLAHVPDRYSSVIRATDGRAVIRQDLHITLFSSPSEKALVALRRSRRCTTKWLSTLAHSTFRTWLANDSMESSIGCRTHPVWHQKVVGSREQFGGAGRDRTCDQGIMSPLL